MSKFICGLGNPEEKYANTRHNIGWHILDGLIANLEKINVPFDNGLLYYNNICDAYFIKSLTGMNSTGECIKNVVNLFNINIEKDLLIISDDISLPFGKIRLRFKGSSGNHNGLKSIIQSLNSENFARLKIGIGKPNCTLIDYVLSEFTNDEKNNLYKISIRGASAVNQWIKFDGNIDHIMNEINKLNSENFEFKPA